MPFPVYQGWELFHCWQELAISPPDYIGFPSSGVGNMWERGLVNNDRQLKRARSGKEQ